jgi:hypothetical protein
MGFSALPWHWPHCRDWNVRQASDERLAALGWDPIVGKDTKDQPISPGWTIRDLRRVARSLMRRQETGVSRDTGDTAERVLGHVIGSKVERTYDRDEYIEAKGEALAALAALVERIIDPPPADDGKVVELAQRRGWRGALELVPQYQIYEG